MERIADAAADIDLSCEVVDHIRAMARHQRLEAPFADVESVELETSAVPLPGLREVGEGARRQVIDTEDPASILEEPGDQVRPDEAGGAGHQDRTIGCGHRRPLSGAPTWDASPTSLVTALVGDGGCPACQQSRPTHTAIW